MPDSQQLYYVNTGNGPAGPYTLVAIHTMVRSGQLSSNVQVRLPDGADWIPLPTMEESPFQKVMKWVKDKAVNGLFTDSEVLEVRVSFSGRTRRRNYIMTQLCVFGLFIVSDLVACLIVYEFGSIGGSTAELIGMVLALPLFAFILWLLLVSVSATVRRLHDMGIPDFHPILVLTGIVYFKDSVPGSNQWGENPKGIEGDVYPNPYDGTGMPPAPVMPVSPSPASPQVEEDGLSQTSPAPPNGDGVSTAHPPRVNHAQPFTPQHQVVPPPPVALQVGTPPPFPAACPPSPAVSEPGTKTMYYILIDGANQGPFEAQNIVQMLASGQVAADTPVCVEGMEQWLPIRQVQLV